MTAKDPLAEKIYEVWINQKRRVCTVKRYELSNDINLQANWKCRAFQGNKNAIKYYDSAIKNSMCNLVNLTAYAMRLIMEMEQFLIFYTKKDIKQLNKIISSYKKFIKSDIPESMKTAFSDWNIFEQNITPKSCEKIRKHFLESINKIPLI